MQKQKKQSLFTVHQNGQIPAETTEKKNHFAKNAKKKESGKMQYEEKNPFENKSTMNYAKYVKEIFFDKKSGECVKLNMMGKPKAVVRSTLQSIKWLKCETMSDLVSEEFLWVRVVSNKNYDNINPFLIK